MKKHKLLREDILPAMASNRKVQRLLNEFMDLLSEYETTETNPDPDLNNSIPLTTMLATDRMDTTHPATDQIASALPELDETSSDKTGTAPAATNQIDLVAPAINEAQSTAPTTNEEVTIDTLASDQQLHPAAQLAEEMAS
ncbi:hypothetical protein U1Q18_025197 [Sarracenia purpurea var. burkii]